MVRIVGLVGLILLSGCGSLPWTKQLFGCDEPLASRVVGKPLVVDARDWVLDIGECRGSVCKANVPDQAFGRVSQFYVWPPSGYSQVDVSVGALSDPSYPTWDMSEVDGIQFYFKDLNRDKSLYHYALVYDDKHCYREWVFGSPETPLHTGVWYAVNLPLDSPHIQGGGKNCATQEFGLSQVSYFEVGIFGPSISSADHYHWQVGPVLMRVDNRGDGNPCG